MPRHAAELVAESIRIARARKPRPEITGSRWQASNRDVRDLGLRAGFEIGSDGSILGQVIGAYNQAHPDHPY